MTDLDPEIWDNPTLGAAANNKRLDVEEKQEWENRNAKLEDREPREVVVDNNYPGWTPDVQERTGTVPSNAAVVHFADENPNDVVQSGEGVKPEGMSDSDWSPEGGEAQDSEAETSEVQPDEVSSSTSDPTEESDSTKWS